MPLIAPICFALIALARQPVGSSPAAPPAAKARPSELSFALRIVRQDQPVAATTPGNTPVPPAPVVLSSPTLTTVDGQTASIEIKGTDTTFFVSLSPTLEPADNANKTGGEVANVATTRVFWSWRFSGKGLPGGVITAALTGASRLIVDDPTGIVITRISLTDPKTGVVSEYRLEGRTFLTDNTKSGVAAPVTPAPVKP